MGYVRRTLQDFSTGFGGVVKLVRADLGITAFGVQVFELGPSRRGPRHRETGGQEELYVNLAGGGWIDVDGERIEFGPGAFIFVSPDMERQPLAAEAGLTYLCIGGRPGRPYTPHDRFTTPGTRP